MTRFLEGWKVRRGRGWIKIERGWKAIAGTAVLQVEKNNRERKEYRWACGEEHNTCFTRHQINTSNRATGPRRDLLSKQIARPPHWSSARVVFGISWPRAGRDLLYSASLWNDRFFHPPPEATWCWASQQVHVHKHIQCFQAQNWCCEIARHWKQFSDSL